MERNKIIHTAVQAITLAILWLLLSGHYTPLILSLGLLSIITVLIISFRMNLIAYDQPVVPMQILKFIPYLFWLVYEILKSNIDVCKRILNPKLPISPQLVNVKSTQHSDLGKVSYANSITLTPGTISIDIKGSDIEVHVLSKGGIDELQDGEMDMRLSKSEIK
jgi:multicomponent Na+:H+ antiporter subunit E